MRNSKKKGNQQNSGVTKGKRSRKAPPLLPVLEPGAAGIDVGATEMWVAVGPDRDLQAVRKFETFTRDLLALIEWLQQCGVTTVAMESTGVYWIPLFQLLEQHGFEVCLTNARHVKNVPGRKSDVRDCQWLQHLHSVGLLHASFRPADQVCALRSLLRHRDSLVQMSSAHIQHMQKAMDQMNLQLQHVISDITGETGLAIIRGILAGERDPAVLAQQRDPRIKASRETIVKSLEGDYRPELVFVLRQSLSFCECYWDQIRQCEEAVGTLLHEFDSSIDIEQNPLPPPARRSHETHCELAADTRLHLYRIYGTDLTAVPGFQTQTVRTIFSEIGCDLSRFRTAGHLVSWLALCPGNDKSGGRVLRTRTRKVKSRLATALRLAAQSLERSDTFLGGFLRRMKARSGAPEAITATAAKLARIVYHLITTRQAYDESVFAQHQHRHHLAREKRLRAQAKGMGFELVPIPA